MTGGGEAPLLSWRGALLSLAVAFVLCWPMLIVTSPLGYSDTQSYYNVGKNTFALIGDKIAPSPPPSDPQLAAPASGGATPADPANEAKTVTALRSFVYATFFYGAAQSPLGLAGALIAQTALTVFTLFAFVRAWPARPGALTAASLALLLFASTLPWFASYAMPDILAAAVVLYGALLIRRIDEVPIVWAVLLSGIAAFAIIAHYGHFPLAGGLFAAVLGWRLVRRRLSMRSAILGVLPVLLAVVTNLGGSTVVQDKPSVTPKRLPLLLARSLEDGPAHWYLTEACPEADYAICTLFDEIPDNITKFMWREEGLGGATPEQVQAIRDEELRIVMESFRRYPVAQTRALVGNGLLQVVAVGTGQIMPVAYLSTDPIQVYIRKGRPAQGPVIWTFDFITPVGTAVAIAALAVLAWRRRLESWEIEVIAVIALALLINAAIFGGLSAPVDRYQSRIIWLLPACLSLFLWRREGRDKRAARASVNDPPGQPVAPH